jgi:putative oxidoreductase
MMDAGLLISRVVLGLAMSAHGAQKLFGWFGGYGPKGTGGFFESLGFRPGVFFAVAAGAGEVVGGLLTAIGFLGPTGPALIILVMLVAVIAVHWQQGFFADSKGIELPLLYVTAALALGVTGPGEYSLDGLFGLSTHPARRSVDCYCDCGGDRVLERGSAATTTQSRSDSDVRQAKLASQGKR